MLSKRTSQDYGTMGDDYLADSRATNEMQEADYTRALLQQSEKEPPGGTSCADNTDIELQDIQSDSDMEKRTKYEKTLLKSEPTVGQHNGIVLASNEPTDQDPPCGWGKLTPKCLQGLRKPKVFLFCLCWANAIQGMAVTGFFSVVISTIEKRFDLSSQKSGSIASCFDIASVLCLIPVSYFGGLRSKPKWIGTGMFILGIGSLLFAMPHFTTGLYRYEKSHDENLCVPMAANVTDYCSKGTDTTSFGGLLNYKYVFMLAHLLHGAGASPLLTLGVTYIDENIKPKLAPLFIAVFYSMALVGPAIGYVIGGQFLNIYTDFGSKSLSNNDVIVDSPNWVGAWWIGFLISGCLSLAISIPLSSFPKVLPGAAKIQAEKVSEAYKGSDSATAQPGFGLKISDIPSSLKILLTNPTFMFLNLAGASEGILIAGFTVFAPKFIESQFSTTAGNAAQIIGTITIPAGGGGVFLGGYLVKRFDLKTRGLLKLCLTTTFMAMITVLAFFVQCREDVYAGVNIDYMHRNATYAQQRAAMESFTIANVNLTAMCNENCHCSRKRFDPVCGVDSVKYFSPCIAGCSEQSMLDNKKGKVYFNCSCVQPPAGHLPSDYMAVAGKCESKCNLLWVFMLLFSLLMLCTFTTSMPALSATLRCVSAKQKSFALGIQWILVRTLGTIPSPIIAGGIIDGGCRLWQQLPCSQDDGSCYAYENATISFYVLALAVSCKFLSFTFFALALLLYKPPPSKTVIPTLPGDQVSASSTMQMLERDKSTLSASSSPSPHLSGPKGSQSSIRTNKKKHSAAV